MFLDASSTTFFLARRIAESGLHVRVLTNSLPVLYELSNCPEPGPEIVAVGAARSGQARRDRPLAVALDQIGEEA